MKTDLELYRLFLDGDITAFETLVLNNKDNLIYFLQRYVKDIDTCEDIAQDVFATIFVCKEKYDLKHNFKTFIFTIGKNKAIDYIRKHSKLTSLQEDTSQSAPDELLEKVLKDEQAKLVHATINQLKPDYQQAIHLIDFEDLSYSQAADVMGKTVPQVKILIFRARKALKERLVKGGYIYEK